MSNVGAVAYDTYSPASAGGVPYDRPADAVPMYEGFPEGGAVGAQEWSVPYRQEISKRGCQARLADGSACTAPPLKQGATEYCSGHARQVGFGLTKSLIANAHSWGFQYDRG